MVVRKEPRRICLRIIRFGEYRATVTQKGSKDEPVRIVYWRYTHGNPAPVVWRPTPESTMIVECAERAAGLNLEEGKRIALETMQKLSSGELSATESPYV